MGVVLEAVHPEAGGQAVALKMAGEDGMEVAPVVVAGETKAVPLGVEGAVLCPEEAALLSVGEGYTLEAVQQAVATLH